MDVNAINKIAELAIQASEKNRLGTFVPALLAGDKPVSLEHLQQYRSRFRGTFSTRSIRDFAEYVKAHADDAESQGFVDTETLSATVFLNIGNSAEAGHADWRAKLTPKATAAYAAVLKIDGERLTQKGAIDWLEDWHVFLSAHFGEEKRPLSAVVAAIREIKVSSKGEEKHVENENSRKRSAMEEVEASAAGGIPTTITVRVEPYEELKLRDFPLRLSIITGGPAPLIAFRLAQREAIEEEIAQEFKGTLASLIGDTPTLTVGTFAP